MKPKVSEPARGKPAHVSRVGNVKVPVYRHSGGRWCVAWRQTSGGKRTRQTFPTRAQAITRADEVAFALANSLADVVTLTSADRDNYRLAIQALQPLGIPLHAAISEYKAAKEALGKHTLAEATSYFLRGHSDRLSCPGTPQILAELLAKLRDDRRDEKIYILPISRDLAPFAKAHPDLKKLTEDEIRAYLRALRTKRATRDESGAHIPLGAPVSPRRRDNVRDAIVLLMRFAKTRSYLPDKRTVAENIPRIGEGHEVTTYTPQQIAQILNHFATSERDRVWLPWAAIAAFAGLRSSEILRLQWSALKWQTGTIGISGKVAKKIRISRQTPILPALAEWLAPWRDSTGPVIPRKWCYMEAEKTRALARLREALGWQKWDKNALRHSFGSHRLAIVKSEEQVSLEMGNSPQMVRENYNDAKPESEAITYFAIRPPDSAKNLVQFHAAAK